MTYNLKRLRKWQSALGATQSGLYIDMEEAIIEIESLRAQLAEANRKLTACSNLGDEFDRMHDVVASRYVAERIFAIIYDELSSKGE